MKSKWPILTIIIGNTHTSLARWKDWRFVSWKTGSTIPRSAKVMLTDAASNGVKVLIAGVVPGERRRIEKFLSLSSAKAFIYRRDFRAGIEIAPSPAEKVGDDRLLGGLGALTLGSRPWVTVDTGTAMTVNSVRPGGRRKLPRFEGGLILPGAQLSLDALGFRTAQPPRLKFSAPRRKSFVGRNTVEAIQLGVFHAQLASAVALARGQMAQLGGRAHVMLTGGLAYVPEFRKQFIASLGARRVSFCGPQLLHFGLGEAWRRSKHG